MNTSQETLNLVSKNLPRQFIKINVDVARGSWDWEQMLRADKVYDINCVEYSRKDWGW